MRASLQPLRVLTINTGKCDGPYRARLAWLAEELAELEPDIIACQETFVAEDGSLSTPRTLAERLGMHLAVANARFKVRLCEGEEIAGWSGLALLGRQPWLRTALLNLPADPRDGERVARLAVCEWDGRELIMGSVHLTHLRDADHLRLTQLSEVLSQPLYSMAGSVRLLCGDFNTTPEGPVLAPLLQGSGRPSVRDAYQLADGCEPRGTLPLREGMDARAADARIDLILSIAATESSHPPFQDVQVVLNRPQPETGILPSDHFGVMATVLI